MLQLCSCAARLTGGRCGRGQAAVSLPLAAHTTQRICFWFPYPRLARQAALPAMLQ